MGDKFVITLFNQQVRGEKQKPIGNIYETIKLLTKTSYTMKKEGIDITIAIAFANTTAEKTITKFKALANGVMEQYQMGLLTTRDFCRQTLALCNKCEEELTEIVGKDKACELVAKEL